MTTTTIPTSQQVHSTLQQIEEELSSLRTREEELQTLLKLQERMPEAQQLAERLHKYLCHWDHTDQCDWLYESWDSFSVGRMREKYLLKAFTLLAHYEGETISGLLTLLFDKEK